MQETQTPNYEVGGLQKPILGISLEAYGELVQKVSHAQSTEDIKTTLPLIGTVLEARAEVPPDQHEPKYALLNELLANLATSVSTVNTTEIEAHGLFTSTPEAVELLNQIKYFTSLREIDTKLTYREKNKDKQYPERLEKYKFSLMYLAEGLFRLTQATEEALVEIVENEEVIQLV